MANITKEINKMFIMESGDNARKRILKAIKKEFNGTPITILEFVSCGNPDTHYRHFMILSEGNLNQEKENKIVDIFKRYTTRKCEVHFNGDILVYEIGPMYQWITSHKSEMINV